LIDARADKHIWAESYERDSHDVFALQDELASAIAREINVELTPQEKAQFTIARPVNPQAHEEYLKGRYYWAKWTQEGRTQAKEHFELAIKIDPDFALGYAGLADYYWQAADWDLPNLVAMPKARELANRALQLDDSLAEAHTSLGAVGQYFDFNPAASELQLQRAIALNPGYAEAHHVYGLLLTAQARFEQAQTQMEEAHQLDPLSPQFAADVGLPVGWGGQPETALRLCDKAVNLDPSFFYGHFCRALNFGLLGNRKRALAEAQSGFALEPSPLIMAALGFEYAVSGNRAEAQKLIDELDQMSRKSYVSEYYPATIEVGLGERENAVNLLEKAYQERSGALVFIGVDPRFDSLRSEPRFKDLLKRVGSRT
jgi:Tfp pilus assembly protein PilF